MRWNFFSFFCISFLFGSERVNGVHNLVVLVFVGFAKLAAATLSH